MNSGAPNQAECFMSWVKEADLPDPPKIFKAISSNGQALELVEQLNEGIAFSNSALTRVQEEAIATAVSVANRCRYGALTHGGFFGSTEAVLIQQANCWPITLRRTCLKRTA